MNNSSSADGSQQANLADNEDADTKYGMSGAEASMTTLVNGHLVTIGHPTDDVADDQLMNRYTSDEERSLQGFDEKTYENSEAALHSDGPDNMRDLNDTVAEADLTQETVPTKTDTTDHAQTQTAGWATLMVPTAPGVPMPTPAPYPPMPPTAPTPGPEIPDLPNQPAPGLPEIQEPSQPDRSHEINAQIAVAFAVPMPAPTETH